VTTIEVTGTWATADTGTITCNGKDLTLTVGSTATIAEVVAAMVAAFNASSKTDAVRSDESRNVGGQEIPEFTEIEATDTSPYITLTARTAGKPFTVSVSESTTGNGALGSPTNSVSATGKHFWDNADNWTTGTIPANTDDIYFDAGDVPCLYNIDQNGLTLGSLNITQNYEGYIGLPDYNEDNGAAVYREYREPYLKISATTVNVGQGAGNGSGRIKWNAGSVNTTLNVFNTGRTLEDGVESLQFVGTGSANVVNVKKGSVAIARQAGETATVATLKVSYNDNPAGDAQVRVGSGTTLTTVYAIAGTTEVFCAFTTARVWGGTLITNGTGAVTTLDIDSGTVHSNSTGTVTTATVGTEGALYMTGDPRARTIGTLNLHKDAIYDDSLGIVTLTNPVVTVQCSLDQTRHKFGMNRTATISAPA